MILLHNKDKAYTYPNSKNTLERICLWYNLTAGHHYRGPPRDGQRRLVSFEPIKRIIKLFGWGELGSVTDRIFGYYSAKPNIRIFGAASAAKY